jgi:hypothetical protein
MIGLEDRRALARDITQAHAAGARLRPACAIAGIELRTLQRWQAHEGLTAGDGRPQAVRPTPSHALSPHERARLLAVANEPRFAAVPPARIVPMLADEGVYLASESSFTRVLRVEGQSAHRGRAKAPRAVRPPTTHIATAPRQVWCWDMTYLPAQVLGRWFHLYLILDLYSRKVVGWEVHDTDDSDHAAHLVRRTALAESIATLDAKPVLHVLAAPCERRQRLCRELVPNGEVPARVPGQGLRRSRTGAHLGGRLRALVQPRPPTQRHSIRQPGSASCRRRPPDLGRSARAVHACSRAQPGTLVGRYAQLVAHWRSDSQPRT